MKQVLRIEHISKSFGGLKSVDDLSFDVNKGEIVSLVGPNGAGKTTTFNIITGYYSPNSGKVSLGEKQLTGLKPFEIFQMGIARTFQIVKPISRMTAFENVLVGATFGKRNRKEKKPRTVAYEALEKVGLTTKAEVPSEQLTFAELRRLEIARAIAGNPSIILMDESMAGLNPAEVTQAVSLVRKLQQEGLSILLIEHVMEAVMKVSDRVVVIDHGAKIAEGTPEQVSSSERVIEAYLGETIAANRKS